MDSYGEMKVAPTHEKLLGCIPAGFCLVKTECALCQRKTISGLPFSFSEDALLTL